MYLLSHEYLCRNVSNYESNLSKLKLSNMFCNNIYVSSYFYIILSIIIDILIMILLILIIKINLLIFTSILFLTSFVGVVRN